MNSHVEWTYWMRYWGKDTVGLIDERGWGRSDGDVDPFVLFRIWNNEINCIVWIPRLVI